MVANKKNPWDISPEEDEVAEPPKRTAGRPKGSLNKPVIERMLINQFETLYKEIEPSLSEEQRKVFKAAFDAKAEFDSLERLERLGKLLDVYSTVLVLKGIKTQTASKETGEVVNQYRQVNVNIEDIKRKREDTKVKNNDDGRMVDPTRESTLGRFENLRR